MTSSENSPADRSPRILTKDLIGSLRQGTVRECFREAEQEQLLKLMCSVCCEKLGENDNVMVLPCADNHVFHYTCVRAWYLRFCFWRGGGGEVTQFLIC